MLAPLPQPERTVHAEDAIGWLERSAPLAGCSMITSLPDVSEFPALSLAEWKRWFIDAAALTMARSPDDGVAIFYQTDVKKQGAWVDKGYLCARAAEQAGLELLWHKVVCRRPPGTITFGRPAWSHLCCFARKLRADLARSTADVIPEPGEMTWTRGMGLQACLIACRYVLDSTPTRTVVDPFCGHGTVLAVANALGLGAVGVELSPKRARRARGLQVTLGPEGPRLVAGAGERGGARDDDGP